jgi:mRNA-degrading endonuclease RelE of RelBE toxin-antitoxin system
MKWQHSDRSKKDYDGLEQKIQKAFDKQARLLADNLLHPSLHAKKYNEAEDLWQARVNKAWRFYFKIEDDTCIIAGIVPHPKK